MEVEAKDQVKLSERFDLLMDSFEELETISGSNESGENDRVRITSLLRVLNQNLAEWGCEAVSRVGFYEELSIALLQDAKDKKKKIEIDKAA